MIRSGPESAGQPLRTLARPVVRLAREFPPHFDMLRQRRQAQPLAVFLPCEGRQGAALLRIYNVAQGLRKRGWRTLALSPKLTLAQRHRVLHRFKPDLLVMQGVRHALNRPAFYPGQPIVFDMDDADFHLPHLEGALRRAMPDVRTVIAGSRYVADWCLNAGAGEAHVVWTGAPVSRSPRPEHRKRPPVVAWAQTRPMTYTREAARVRRTLRALSESHPDVRLRLFDRRPGDDPAFLDRFHAAGIQTEWVDSVEYSDYLNQFDDVSLGLAPLETATPFSRGKSFGKVLAYLDRQVPVIASDACEHAAFFTPQTGVVSNDPQVWLNEARRLLSDAQARQTMAKAATKAFRDTLSVSAAVARIDPILRSYIT